MLASSMTPRQQFGPLSFCRLLLLPLGRHLPKVDLLLDLVQEIEPVFERKLVERIQPHVSLFLPLVVAAPAVVLDEIRRCRAQRRSQCPRQENPGKETSGRRHGTGTGLPDELFDRSFLIHVGQAGIDGTVVLHRIAVGIQD